MNTINSSNPVSPRGQVIASSPIQNVANEIATILRENGISVIQTTIEVHDKYITVWGDNPSHLDQIISILKQNGAKDIDEQTLSFKNIEVIVVENFPTRAVY